MSAEPTLSPLRSGEYSTAIPDVPTTPSGRGKPTAFYSKKDPRRLVTPVALVDRSADFT